MAANKKNSNLTKTNKREKQRAGRPQGNNRYMSSGQVAVAPVQTVKPTTRQSNHSRISVELDSHADTCVVGSNVLVIHNHECFVNVYRFNKGTRHSNVYTINTTIANECTPMTCSLLNNDVYLMHHNHIVIKMAYMKPL